MGGVGVCVYTLCTRLLAVDLKECVCCGYAKPVKTFRNRFQKHIFYSTQVHTHTYVTANIESRSRIGVVRIYAYVGYNGLRIEFFENCFVQFLAEY